MLAAFGTYYINIIENSTDFNTTYDFLLRGLIFSLTVSDKLIFELFKIILFMPEHYGPFFYLCKIERNELAGICNQVIHCPN